MTSIVPVNLAEKFSLFNEHWSPKIVGEFNDMEVKVAKLCGEFVWHRHELADEMFLVVEGQMCIRFRDHDVHVSEGDFVIVPRGVEHQPVAENEVSVVLIEPRGTLNTGNVESSHTVVDLDRI